VNSYIFQTLYDGIIYGHLVRLGSTKLFARNYAEHVENTFPTKTDHIIRVSIYKNEESVHIPIAI